MSSTNRFLLFSKPFMDAAQNVFQTMMNTKIIIHKPELKKEKGSKGDISALMAITGKVLVEQKEKDFNGLFVMSFPKETYIQVASAMLMEEFKEISDANSDAGAEISNMITGNAKRSLAGLGYKIEMSIPSTIVGMGHEVKYPSNTHVIIIPIECDHGKFYIELCYQDVNVLGL